jgi:hypothetical protein
MAPSLIGCRAEDAGGRVVAAEHNDGTRAHVLFLEHDLRPAAGTGTARPR